MPGAALRRPGQPPGPVQGQDHRQGLSGARAGRPALDLHGPRPRALPARLGAVQLEERVRPGRLRRGALQLAAGPGKLHRPGPFRVDAHQLERPPARRDRALWPPPPEGRVRGVRVRADLQAHPRRHRRAERSVDRRPRGALAHRLLPRRPLRMAHADRRRNHPVGHLVLLARAQRDGALRAERHPLLDRADP